MTFISNTSLSTQSTSFYSLILRIFFIFCFRTPLFPETCGNAFPHYPFLTRERPRSRFRIFFRIV